ncbi:MAG: hypothetical protein AB1502_10750 [Thermodesulfobacteriota bacterium]
MKRLIGILISFSLVVAIGCATHKNDFPVYLPNENCKLVSFKPGLEPEGFNGIKWETKLSTLEGMKHYRTDPSHGGIEFYLKERDAFKLGNGKLTTIQYGFWKEKFYVGMVTTQDLPNWNSLKEAVFDKFGEGGKPFRNKEEYLWVGKDAVMALRYNEISKEGFFYIRSDSMAK